MRITITASAATYWREIVGAFTANRIQWGSAWSVGPAIIRVPIGCEWLQLVATVLNGELILRLP